MTWKPKRRLGAPKRSGRNFTCFLDFIIWVSPLCVGLSSTLFITLPFCLHHHRLLRCFVFLNSEQVFITDYWVNNKCSGYECNAQTSARDCDLHYGDPVGEKHALDTVKTINDAISHWKPFQWVFFFFKSLYTCNIKHGQRGVKRKKNNSLAWIFHQQLIIWVIAAHPL